jgi:plastocyanin
MAALLGVAFNKENGSSPAATAASGLAPSMGAMGTAGAAPVETMKLVVKSDEEKGKMGPDGNWHDAFLPADFSIKAGATVQVTVYNYDDMPHTFTAPGLGVNAQIPGGSEDKPGEVTFTIHAPDEAGSYGWYCAAPCDPWAMSHMGYMKGRVRVT